jgi:hypothetical protein
VTPPRDDLHRPPEPDLGGDGAENVFGGPRHRIRARLVVIVAELS